LKDFGSQAVGWNGVCSLLNRRDGQDPNSKSHDRPNRIPTDGLGEHTTLPIQ
jgi:hypothetical protein